MSARRLPAAVRILLAVLVTAGAARVAAQVDESDRAAPPAGGLIDGYVSLLVDYLPNTHDTLELRARWFGERTFTAGSHLTIKLAGFVEGLVADRNGSEVHAIARPQDVYLDLAFERFDLRAGFTRIVWGRLDELQPGDVVNPLDVTRFFFEGRSEARLPVALMRGRWFLPRGATLEGILVPVFRPGRFDQLDESTAPFNLVAGLTGCAGPLCPRVEIDRREPKADLEGAQGGVRLTATTRRVDWGLSAFRGFEPFGLYRTTTRDAQRSRTAVAVAIPQPLLRVEEVFPRFTMVSTDFETVRGEWAVRGEVAAFLADNFQAPLADAVVRGRSIEAGVGLERKAGDYRLSGTILVQHRSAEASIDDTGDVSVIAGADRSFARETKTTRIFVVYNARERSAFLRNITAVSLRDNVWLEGSIGWFVGEGAGTIGRFSDRDFLYGRLKVYF